VGDGKRVDKVEDYLNVGDKVEVSIADIDARGKIYLDKVRPEGEEAPAAPESAEGSARPPREDRGGDRGGEPRRRRSRPSGDRGGDRGSAPRD
jgi:polyribonucleotide nucleotidyltransferase